MRKMLFLFFLLSFTAYSQDKLTFSSISIGPDTTLDWKVQHNKEGMYLIVQQNRWNAWKDLDTIRSGADADSAAFTHAIKKYILNGENKFRVRAVADKMLVYSKIVKITGVRSPSKDIRKKYRKKDTIEFGREEFFELYDSEAKVIRRGFTASLPLSALTPGHYFLNYGDVIAEFNLSE